MPSTISVNFTTKAEVLGSNPPTVKSVSASVLRSVLDTGGGGSGYVTVASAQTITGAKTFSAAITGTSSDFSSTITAGTGTNGYARLTKGSATNPGYLAWFTPDDVRRGYVGWQVGTSNDINFSLENGWGLNINSPSKPVLITGDLTVTGNTTGIIPVGAVMAFGMNSAPAGWLICDGNTIPTSGTLQGVDAALLQTLRGLLGTSHGALGQLPDLQGLFVRGRGSSVIGSTTYTGTFALRGGDATKRPTTALTGVAASAGAHSHTYTYRSGTAQVGNSFQGAWVGTNANTNTGSAGAHTHTVTINAGGDAETRPANIALLYCIKF